jgi:hypothetical protein
MKKFKTKHRLIDAIMFTDLDTYDDEWYMESEYNRKQLSGLPSLDEILEKKSMNELKQLYEKQIDFLKELHFILFTNYIVGKKTSKGELL